LLPAAFAFLIFTFQVAGFFHTPTPDDYADAAAAIDTRENKC